jgi:hypothetical protein
MYLNIIDFNISSLDKTTIITVLAGQIIIIAILFLLYRIYSVLMPELRKAIHNQKKVDEISLPGKMKDDTDENINAAIAIALYLHFNEIHDEESNIITIQRVSKTYSPWSSKIYNMRNFK